MSGHPNVFPAKPQSYPLEANETPYCAFFNVSKHAEYDFLSNFHPYPVQSEYGVFQCAEGFYQYLKFAHLNDIALLQRFLSAKGQEAWDLSRMSDMQGKIDPAWNRESAMRKILQAKFSAPELKEKLLATGDKYLVENAPNGHDAFWSDNGDGTGQNKLGQFLMELRAELGGAGVEPRPSILDLFYAHKCDYCTNCSHFTNKGVFYNYCDAHMTKDLVLGHFRKEIHLSDIPTGTGRFLYFKTNDIPELVEEGARLIAERIKSLGLKNPFFVTPEASTFAIAHLLRTKYDVPGIVVSKSKKPTDFETFSVAYSAITSTEQKKLYLDAQQAKEMQGKDLVLFDNVCTTGETLRAVYELLIKAHVPCDKISEAIVLFTEGEDAHQLKISDGLTLPLHRFCHLPLFPADPSVDKTRYRLYAAATIPTERGENTLAVFHDRMDSDGKEAIAYYRPDTFDKGYDDILIRVHDACATSELFGSVKCDCKEQLEKAKEIIAAEGGILIYLNQEGRGIGLGNKIAAYHLQQTQGLNTVQANRALGLPDDIRKYEAVKDILKALGVKSIRLLSNNPRKAECLTSLGVVVNGMRPCVVKPKSEAMASYMRTKAEEMRHAIDVRTLVMTDKAPAITFSAPQEETPDVLPLAAQPPANTSKYRYEWV